jgi:hypothetical protein
MVIVIYYTNMLPKVLLIFAFFDNVDHHSWGMMSFVPLLASWQL